MSYELHTTWLSSLTDRKVDQQTKETHPKDEFQKPKEAPSALGALARSIFRGTAVILSVIAPRTGIWRCPFQREDAGGI
jgi:hypothetical protein